MKQIEIEVDWNDGDYETIRKKLSDDKLDYFRPLFQAISKKGKRHNWVQGEREGYLGPLIDMYPDIPEEVLNEFPVEKNEKYECWQSTSDTCDYCNLQPNLFPDVSWRDGNPTEVKLVMKRNKNMCIRDRTKVCNLCHECDVYVLNPNY